MKLIGRETYDEWFTRIRGKMIVFDLMLGGYDFDELEDAIFKAMKDMWGNCGEEYAVSISEIARIFDRDPHNIRDTMKRMERKGMIRMVEYRRTPDGQTEKRYAPKQLYRSNC
jgi:hypothetical protein